MGNSIYLHNVKKFKIWTKTLLLKTCSDLLFCGSIFIVVTSQRFLHICYMGYLTLIRYFFMGGMTTSRYLKIWSDLANLKYLGNKELLNKFHICAKWVTKTHIWAHLTAPQSAGWLTFPNTVMASISKLTNVLDSKNCCGC